MARKGANTPDRPHRPSRILHVPDEVKPTSIELFKLVAALLPQPEPQSNRGFSRGSGFDVEEFIARHNIPVAKKAKWSGGTKYVLNECLFDPSHKAPDAAIIQLDNGALAYNCFHNTCQKFKWQDVRQKFEPTAYAPQHPSRVTKPPAFAQVPVKATSPPAQDRFLRLQDIQRLDRSQIVAIPSGIHELDNLIIGFNKGELSVWSGGNGSGKSTLLSQIALETINRGFRVALFSGELTSNRVKNWLTLQAVGRQYVVPSQYNNVYFVPPDIGDEIDKWAADMLWVYNNNYGMDAQGVVRDLEAHMTRHPTDVVIIDNLMSLDMRGIQGERYEKQSALVLKLAAMAKSYNIHVHFVCHPRKPMGFLRKSDISGTADITNAADTVLMMHRVNNDFRKHSKEFFPKGVADQYFHFSNVIEIMKNRDLGIEDELVGLYYERESKRLLNRPHENKVYNWRAYPFGNSTTLFDNDDVADDDSLFTKNIKEDTENV